MSEVKHLPVKWKEHIRKMTEYAMKSNQMISELEKYLISKGFTDPAFEETDGSMFQDSIIDTTQQNYDWESLIIEIESVMNGVDYCEITQYLRERKWRR